MIYLLSSIRRGLLPAMLVALGALGAAACSDNTTTTAPTTTTTVTDTFSGTLNKNGGVTFAFVAGGAGTITAILTAADPAVAIGVALGTIGTTGSCAIAIVPVPEQVTVGGSVSGKTSAAGSLCARVYDVGNITDATTPVAFTITVAHP